MIFEYQSKIYLGEVALYVADLARQKDFYQRVLGLELFWKRITHKWLWAGMDKCW